MTQRSKSELDTLFANNITGAITPGYLRDFVDTVNLSHGSLYVTASTPTTIVTPGTFVKMAGATALVSGNRFTMPADNRLAYPGLADVHARVSVTVSILAGDDGQVLNFAVAKNGVVLTHSIMSTKLTTGADVSIITVNADCIMSTNDYLELWCANETSTSTVTAERAYMYVSGLFSDDD